ncbi:MAG TPA: hypothetical protein EYQ50_25540 [Verrucomicrobiales bacterium]|nr:hypothetical protein [Verrucomicrobiales bacterium]
MTALAVDTDGWAVVTGLFQGEADLNSDPEEQVFFLSQGTSDVFLSRNWTGFLEEPEVPEMILSGGGLEIANGNLISSTDDGTYFETGVIGDVEILHIFQIENKGASNLDILSITVPQGFQLMKAPATSVSPGSLTDFVILMETESVGLKSGLVILDNNDSDQNPYTFFIEGRVLESTGVPIQIFTNRRLVRIPDHSVADPNPSRITVTGIEGTVDSLSVTLNELSHGFSDDLDVLLVEPGGTRGIILMSDAGGKNSLDSVSLEFRDDAPTLLPDELMVESGTYKPSDHGEPDAFSILDSIELQSQLDDLIQN